jgi:hypothetical protein
MQGVDNPVTRVLVVLNSGQETGLYSPICILMR